MTLQALIFDVDGTLADTEDAHRKAFNAAFSEFGFDWHWDQTRYDDLLRVTGGRNRIRLFLEESAPDILTRDDVDTLIANLHIKKTALYVEMMENGDVPLRPGIENLIREACARKMRIAIATTTTPVNVESLLTSTLGKESLSWFEVIGDGGKVPVLKPEPDVYLWVLAQMNLAPQDCLALEDSSNGIRAARAADIPCVITTNMYTRNHDFTGALRVVDDLSQTGLDDLITLHAAD